MGGIGPAERVSIPTDSLIKALLGTLLAMFLLVLSLPSMATDDVAATANVSQTEAMPAGAEDSLATILLNLQSSNFQEKTKALQALGSQSDERVLPIMLAMLNNQLYFNPSDHHLYIVQGSQVSDAMSGQAAAAVAKDDLSKVFLNNRLRNILNAQIAQQQLMSPKLEQRMKSALELIDKPKEENRALLEKAFVQEKDKTVKAKMEIALALLRLHDSNVDVRLAAVSTLTGVLIPSVRVELEKLLAQNAQGEFAEPDASVRTAAQDALSSIETRLQVNHFAENAYFGIALGAVLLLAAVGLAITFGVMGVINMAHGEMMMLGAYVTFVIQKLMPNALDYSLFVAVPAAFLFTGLVGIVIERSVIRFLYGRPLETLLATFGISLVLQQAVRSIFSPLNQSVSTPSWMSGSFAVNGALSLTYNRLYIILFALTVLAVLVLLLRRTFFGLQMRAVMLNRPMASCMGIRTGWVDALTFGLGSGIAGIAGVALSQLTNVGPNLGQSYIIDSFMVVVFGGVGNLFGTFVAAMSLGIVNKIIEPFSGAVLAKILVLVFIILFIQKRPRGLFALKGRFVEG